MLHINRVGLNEVEFNRLFGADKTFYKLLVNVHPHIALEALHTVIVFSSCVPEKSF